MRHLATLLALALPCASMAADLSMTGACPGPITVEVTSLSPGAPVFIAAGNNLGSTVIGGGPCAGLDVGITGLSVFGPFVDTDLDGAITLSPTTGPGLCQKAFVAVDTTTCTATPPEMLRSQNGCPTGKINAWINPGFEKGDFIPFDSATGGALVTSADVATGTYAAELDNTGARITQTFSPPVPVAALTEASWAWWTDLADDPVSLAQWTYTDGTSGNRFFSSVEMGDWTTGDILDDLDPSKSLETFSIWGYSDATTPLNDMLRIDDLRFCY
jgi:hypothetical protein